MHFALLVSQLPHIDEARAHYDELLSLEPRCHVTTTQDTASMLGALRHSLGNTLGAALHAWQRHH